MPVAGYCVPRPTTGPMKRTSAIALPFVLLGSSGTDVSLCRTRGRIRNFEISVTHDDFPRFLWENEDVDEGDMKKGFLRGDVLVRVRVSFSSAPSFAHLLNASRPSWRYLSLHLPRAPAVKATEPEGMPIGLTCKR